MALYQSAGGELLILGDALQSLRAAVENSAGVAKLIEALPSASHDQLVCV